MLGTHVLFNPTGTCFSELNQSIIHNKLVKFLTWVPHTVIWGDSNVCF